MLSILTVMLLTFSACHCTGETDDEPGAWDVAEGDTKSQSDIGDDADVATPNDTGDTADAATDDTGPRDTGPDDVDDVQDADEDTGEIECAIYAEECERGDCCVGLICPPNGGLCTAE